MIEEALQSSRVSLEDLDCIAFGCGPGSFTGLRITVGVVQGLAFGLDMPVVPISTLAAMAQRQYRLSGQAKCLVAMQARQEEVYWGSYQLEQGLMSLIGNECVIEASEVTLPSVTMQTGQGSEPDDWYGVGNGWKHQELLESALGLRVTGVDLEALPHGQDLLVLANYYFSQQLTITAEEARPVYLRETVAQKAT
jgi:tRNA threonylcarbamoyladenosine biosynthesis protein TsaB